MVERGEGKEMMQPRRMRWATSVASNQPSASVVLSSNLVTDSMGYNGGEISVSAGSNSKVASTVRARVRLVSLSKRAERARRVLVRRVSYWGSVSGMERRALSVERVESIVWEFGELKSLGGEGILNREIGETRERKRQEFQPRRTEFLPRISRITRMGRERTDGF
jgi:hypothetical protein